MTTWAIIPVKPLRDGKSRLAHILSPDQRAELTTGILTKTINVLNQIPAIFRTLVVSRDPAALKVARQQGAQTFGERDKQGLNMALRRGTQIAVAQKASGILVLPADLPLITVGDVETMLAGITPVVSGTYSNGTTASRMIAICPDRDYNGTNGLYIRPPLGFTFRYGEGSYERHLNEARRLGMDCRVVHTPGLKFDLDTEDDWYTYVALSGEMAYAI